MTQARDSTDRISGRPN